MTKNTTMTERPLVSVIIPTFYRNDLLQQAIYGVQNQSYPTEIIVVDDSGENHAKSVISNYTDIKYTALQINRGQMAALNQGLKMASGKYVQFLDDDDKIINEKLSKQVAILEENEEVGVVYGGRRSPSGENILPRSDGRGDLLKEALVFQLNSCVTSTMLIDRNVIDAIGQLPTPPGSTDTHMKVLFAQVTKFDHISEPVIMKRDTEGSVSDSLNAIKGTWLVLDWYSSVYDEFPSKIRKVAISNAAWREAKYHLEQKMWSAKSIYRYYQCVWHNPSPSMGKFLMLVLAWFGRPGKDLLEYLDDVISRF